jgi:hypothetical protein
MEEEVRFATALEMSLEELAPHMGPAAGELDLRAAARKGVVGGVAIALDFAGEVDRDDLLQAGGSAARVPGKDGVGAGAMAGPKITYFVWPWPGSR